VTIPLAPRTAGAIDLAIGERTGGPVFLAADGQRPDRRGAGRPVRKAARRPGSARPSRPPVTDPVLETVLALITPYAAFVAGEVLHVSPVMAVIVAGLVIGGRREQQARGNERPCRDT
jgi:hypothetical protein